jgi:TetR/AcrR family transcriptional repressor of mexCD-oprJ operon
MVRADAQRSIAAILDAAVEKFGTSPDASMTDIAKAAGVGRVTLYGHFASREDLLHAAVGHMIHQVEHAFSTVDAEALPADEALEATLRASWHMIERHRAFFATAMHHHDPAIAHDHDEIFRRLGAIMARGQADGAFRTDQPISWLIAVCMGVVHAAVTQTQSGQMTPAQAEAALLTTVRAALWGENR